jgi:hypothetical protein
MGVQTITVLQVSQLVVSVRDTANEKVVHDQGLVSVLKQIHDDLDAAVAEAYGWPADLADEEILQRLVDLNAERAAEEARGLVRWLRPDFQQPSQKAVQPALDLPEEEAPPEPAATPAKTKAQKLPWPKTPAERIARLQNTRVALKGEANG